MRNLSRNHLLLCCLDQDWATQKPPRKGNYSNIPGAHHILVQPLKRYSASRIKPNGTFELAKKRQNIPCFGVCGVREKEFLHVVAKLRTKSQKPWKISVSYSLIIGMGHFDMVRWKYDCLYFQHVRRYIETDFVEESRQKMHRSEEEHFFQKGVLW